MRPRLRWLAPFPRRRSARDRRARRLPAALALLLGGCAAPASAARDTPAIPEVTRWDVHELALRGPTQGNPFVDVTLQATFTLDAHSVTVDGFYDGDGRYLIRFMPEQVGQWTWRTRSNRRELDGKTGQLRVNRPRPDNRGPVRVAETFHFAYADGTPYYPIGTTAYAWLHQPEAVQERTLATLSTAPFNKLRMTLLPKWYAFNRSEPPRYPFQRDASGQFDLTRPDPVFYRDVEARLRALQKLGVEADLILFHPYDEGHWGFDRMPAEANLRYLRYVIARLAAFRNVWWSVANEWDLVKHKTLDDWNQYLDTLARHDPYRHLTSIHNGDIDKLFDHGRAPITHVSVQHPDTGRTLLWRTQFGKPVVNDECEYEGNVEQPWGNLTPQELVHRFWVGFVQGGYVGHGETYLHPQDEIWWSKGGVLRGQSPARIAFLRRLLDEHGRLDPLTASWMWTRTPAARQGASFVVYFGPHQPRRLTQAHVNELQRGLAPEARSANWRFQLHDVWTMTTTELPGVHSGEFQLTLPERPYLLLRAIPVRPETP